jgi:hypothetical protein
VQRVKAAAPEAALQKKALPEAAPPKVLIPPQTAVQAVQTAVPQTLPETVKPQ